MQTEDTIRGLTLQDCAKLCADLSIAAQCLSKPSKASVYPLRRQLSSGSAGLDEVISCSAGLRDLDQGNFGKLISVALEVHPDIQADAARLSRTLIVAAPWLSIVSMKYLCRTGANQRCRPHVLHLVGSTGLSSHGILLAGAVPPS